MSQFELEILTPEREFYRENVDMLVVKTTDGLRGILARHTPMITTVDVGSIRIKKEGKVYTAAVTEGLMYVTGSKVTVTVDAAEWPEEIDQNRANSAKERAEERLHMDKSKVDYYRAKAALGRALTRIQVSKSESGLSDEQKKRFLIEHNDKF